MVPDSNVAALQPSSGLTVTRVYVHAPQGKQQLCPNTVLLCVPESGWTSVRSPKYSGLIGMLSALLQILFWLFPASSPLLFLPNR